MAKKTREPDGKGRLILNIDIRKNIEDAAIMITDDIEVIILEAQKDRVKVAIIAPDYIKILRKKLWLADQRIRQLESQSTPKQQDLTHGRVPERLP